MFRFKKICLSVAACALLTAPLANAQAPGTTGANGSTASAKSMFSYPKAKKLDTVYDYHGTKVADPYSWLEDPDSAESRAWIEAQNKVTFDYLNKIPARQTIKERLTKLWNYEKYSAPSKQGKYYFYSKNDGLQNQFVLYVANSITDPGRVLLDPNKLSADGTVALNGISISDDGKLIAYGLATAGSDRTEWRVKNVETGEDLPDVLTPARQYISSWTKDGKGFFYSRFPQEKTGSELRDINFNQKFYYHKLGTPMSEDVLVYERPDDKEFFIGGGVTDDGKYLVIQVGKGTSPKNMLYYKDLSKADAKIEPIVDKIEADYSVVGNDDETFFIRTDKDAPRSKLVAYNIETKQWRDVVPQAEETLGSISFINNQFVTNYLKDASTQIKIYDINGKFVREVKLPGIGIAGGFGGKREDTETFYTYSSFNAAPTIYRYDMKSGKSEVFRQAKVDFNPADYEVKRVFYTSKDGTRVPMFITHKKGIKLDGTNPTHLYSYGGFNVPMTPGFSVSNLVWMEMGGIYAQPSIRGGNEYGEQWWKAGTKLQKQNVFDDFIAAGEYLVKEKYTSPSKLAISGGSNGGLLVGAVLNQRPDLFGAAMPAVGVMDMLRFHKFTIGWAWTSDYGSPENPEEFAVLYKYSPLHNIKAGGNYPAVMVTTADHDDRVVPAHSFKYAATLQEANASDRPILIRIETKAGHGAGKPTAKIIEEQADKMGFLVKELGMK
jgi:prolyl oligopeptidase